MDVKAINSTQAALDMHSANTQIQKALDGQKANISSQDRQIETFKQMDQKSQEELIKKTADKLNEKFKLFDSTLKIEIDKDTGIQVVKIIDKSTKKVIRQIPPEAMLKIAKYIDEITGLLFEKKA